MDNLIGLMIFLAIVIFSAVQKAIETARARRNLGESGVDESEPSGQPSNEIPVARPRIDATRRARPATQPTPQIEDVIRRLMGESIEGPASGGDEGINDEALPLPPPVPRHAPTTQPRIPAAQPPRRQMPVQPTQYQKAAPAQRAAPTRRPERRPLTTQPSQRPMPARATNPIRTHVEYEQEAPLPVEVEQRENERRWREEMERRKKAQKPQAPQRSPEVLHTRARLMPARRRLFQYPGDVRRAFILSEVLGPPRAMREIDGPN